MSRFVWLEDNINLGRRSDGGHLLGEASISLSISARLSRVELLATLIEPYFGHGNVYLSSE
jgi:hypothetical protein